MKVRRNPNHKAPSGSLRAPRKAEWRLPSRAVAPPVSYQVDTLAFGVKHTPEMGCYALQTLGSVPVIFIGNTASGDAHSEAAMTRGEGCLCGSSYCAPMGSVTFSSGFLMFRELTTCWVPEEDRSSLQHGVIVRPHIVLLMPLAISTIKKMVIHYRNYLRLS